jgi:uncharacterized protein (UPF0261 family)
VLENLVAQGRVDGVISLGGGGGTAICTQAMRALPIGLPKLMVSTLASGNTAPYVGTRDITMMPAIADVAGINRLTRVIFDNAAGAICGMVEAAAARQAQGANSQDKPLVVASMFGNTTACVTRAKEVLEQAGYEVLVFAATGNGGRSMEALIESGLVSGVLDITTTEWADELCGGVLSAGPSRLEAAGKMGLPAVVAPGCLDMVNFGEAASVPAQYKDRCFYVHDGGGEPRAGPHHRRQAQCLLQATAGHGAHARHQRDQRQGQALPRCAGRCGLAAIPARSSQA